MNWGECVWQYLGDWNWKEKIDLKIGRRKGGGGALKMKRGNFSEINMTMTGGFLQ